MHDGHPHEHDTALADAPDGVLRLTQIIGGEHDPALAGRLHEVSHHGRIEEITLGRDDLARRRIRIHTDAGTDCAIAIARSDKLFDGAVLLLEEARAIVVRMEPERWLSIEAESEAAGLQLGYFAGNMHWRVRFDGTILRIALEGDRKNYLDRLEPVLKLGKLRVLDGEGGNER